MSVSEGRPDADRLHKTVSLDESASTGTPAAQMQRHALEMMVGHLPDAVSLHDAEGTYLYASDVFTDAFGWETDQLVGRDCYLLFHPDDIPDIQTAHSRTLDHVRGLSVQYRLRCADGSYKWVETTSRMTPEGNIVAVTRHIADRRSLLHALDNERMVSERLSEIERERQAFLTAIAHHARHPVTAVSGFAQLLQAGRVVDEDAARSIYDRLVVNAERLRELIELATTAEELSRRANALMCGPVDLSTLVRDVAVDFWDLDHPGETTVSFDLPEQAVVFADRDRLTLAVRALYHNAVKHTPIGTNVWIRVEPHPDGRLLVVEDDGSGVPDVMKSAIFDRLTHGDYEHAHPDPGLGLGLYLVDQIANAHGGQAWVQDRDGGGASFRVVLPVRSRSHTGDGRDSPALRRRTRDTSPIRDHGALAGSQVEDVDFAGLQCDECGRHLDDVDALGIHVTDDGLLCPSCTADLSRGPRGSGRS